MLTALEAILSRFNSVFLPYSSFPYQSFLFMCLIRLARRLEKTNAGKRVVTSKDLDECFLDSYLSPHFFFFQMAFEDPDVQGIYLLTDGKPVSLLFISM